MSTPSLIVHELTHLCRVCAARVLPPVRVELLFDQLQAYVQLERERFALYQDMFADSEGEKMFAALNRALHSLGSLVQEARQEHGNYLKSDWDELLAEAREHDEELRRTADALLNWS